MNEIDMFEYYKTRVTRIQYYVSEEQNKAFMDVFEKDPIRRYTTEFTADDANKQIKWLEDNRLFQYVETIREGAIEKRILLPFDEVTTYKIDDNA